ncbi:hypothetical protein BEWA_049490 [Theileria equi strain WA]|uniref:Uncharacterized protein n=1 Tax=Theileria equi strain WA TaxID=1537102 RepID=L1LAH7_THEEQ|nr:hypothetical protein BEWA_049490 [Theileria equi strain WA]EKX72482.1 hypothetical protein BEWA_049490 [Theileria equi strain WA]|eukprot:XP_004831934.1 hypothetical protein BEWA_049490 [Theileria equi strain WA]
MSQVKGVTIDIGKLPGKNLTPYETEKNKYYYNDDEHRERVDVILTESLQNLPEYVTLTYKPNNPETKIANIEYNGQPKSEFDNDLKDCKSVMVYYWSGDGNYNDPLVLQLGDDNKYYTNLISLVSVDRDSGSLLKLLDKWSCTWNSVHPVDIMQKKSSYNCSSCNQPKINLTSSLVNNKYTKVIHSEYASFYKIVGRLKNGSQNITDIPITKNFSKVCVYWYPLNGEESKPLLIRLPAPSTDGNSSGNLWYRKESSGNKWTNVVVSPPSSPDDCKGILKLLKEISPKSEDEGEVESECIDPNDEQMNNQDSTSSSSLSTNPVTTTSTPGLSHGAIAGITVVSVGTGGSALGYGSYKLFLSLKNPT